MSSLNPETSFALMLAKLWHSRETGVVDVVRDTTAHVYVVDGQPVFADGATRAEPLGELLLRTGKMTPAQHDDAMSRLLELTMEGKDARLGDVLIEMEVLKPSELFDSLGLQTVGRIVDCFSSLEAKCTFKPGDDFQERITALETPNVHRVLLLGIRQAPKELAQQLLADRIDTFPLLSGDLQEVVELYGLNPTETQVVVRIDGQTRLPGLPHVTGADVRNVYGIVAALRLGGHIHFAGAPDKSTVAKRTKVSVPKTASNPELSVDDLMEVTDADLIEESPPPRLPADLAPERDLTETGEQVLAEYLSTQGSNDYLALSVDTGASTDEIEAALEERLAKVEELEKRVEAKEPEPESPEAEEKKVQGSLLGRIRTRLSAAKERLVEMGTAEIKMERGPDKAGQAQRAFDHARRLMKRVGFREEHDRTIYAAALRSITKACDLKPKNTEFQLYFHYISMNTAEDEKARIAHGRDAQERAAEVLKKKPKHEHAHYFLGVIQERYGEEEAALEHFKHALRYNRNDRAALFAYQNLKVKLDDGKSD